MLYKVVYILGTGRCVLVYANISNILDRCPSGFGPPWIWAPGPNPLADMDPRESIFASGFGPPFANLDPPTKVIILYFRTPGVVNE